MVLRRTGSCEVIISTHQCRRIRVGRIDPLAHPIGIEPSSPGRPQITALSPAHGTASIAPQIKTPRAQAEPWILPRLLLYV